MIDVNISHFKQFRPYRYEINEGHTTLHTATRKRRIRTADKEVNKTPITDGDANLLIFAIWPSLNIYLILYEWPKI